jgi:hypothetical protein
MDALISEAGTGWLLMAPPGATFEPHTLIRCGYYFNLHAEWRLIYFDDDWTAHFEKVCADNVPHEYEMIGSQYVAEMMYLMVHYALRPVYAHLGLAWDDLGLPWRHN